MTLSHIGTRKVRTAFIAFAAVLAALVTGCGARRVYYSPAPVVIVHHYGGYGGYGYGGGMTVVHVHHYGGYGGFGGGRTIIVHHHY